MSRFPKNPGKGKDENDRMVVDGPVQDRKGPLGPCIPIKEGSLSLELPKPVYIGS